MPTDAEHEEVLRAIGFTITDPDPEFGYIASFGDELYRSLPALDSPLVRAQMTDWLLDQFHGMSIDRMETNPAFFISLHRDQTAEVFDSDKWCFSFAEALARCVLEVSRAE